MAVRRRHPQPPYEVMGGTRGYLDEPGYRASGWPPTDPDGETVDMEPAEMRGVGGAYMNWRSRTAAPILLRLPRAHALAIGLMFVALVVMVYWVGQQRGMKSAQIALEKRIEQQSQLGRRGSSSGQPAINTPPVASPRTSPGNPSGTSVTGLKPARTAGDRRVVGLNYFIVALLPKTEALGARKFLAGQGVETFVQLVENKGLYEVIALNGFKRHNARARAFELELKRLGRLWKNGPKNFDPWIRKYEDRLARSKQR